jgi:Flp pilus assembly protein TadG
MPKGDAVRGVFRRRGDDRGAVAVEFVLVLPVFLLLIFGLIQYGWYFFQVQNGAFAVREAARQAAVGSLDTAGLQAWVPGRVTGADPASITTEVCFTDTDSSDDLTVGDQISVSVDYLAQDFGFPFVPFPDGGRVTQLAETRTEDVKAATSDYAECS